MGVDEFLAKLTPAQLEEVRTKALFLQRRATTKSENAGEEVYDQLREWLLGKGVGALPYQVFVRTSKRYPAFLEGAKELRAFAVQHLRARTQLERIAAYGLLLRAMDRRTQELAIPRSLASFLNLLPKAPGLLEREFPGYLESGLLPQLLHRRRQA